MEQQRYHKIDSAIETVGRCPWKLESGKKRVRTYLSNLRLDKMDGAYVSYEALDKYCSRLI